MLEISSLDADLRQAFGERGRKRIEEEFTTDVMAKKLTGIYKSVFIAVQNNLNS
jgi:glycosyltransferase involved in cell wall biosynthesis